MMLTRRVAFFLFACVLTSTCFGQANLQITEMWVGGLAGTEATSDWFEVTNFGDMPATGLDGNLYYDDNSADPTVDDQMFGVDTIAPGESVVYLTSWEDDFTLPEAVDAVVAMWGPPAGDLTGVQVGYVDGGSGLGGGGDGVYIFDSNVAGATIIDFELYQGNADDNFASFVSDPNGNFNFPLDRAQDGVWGAFTGNLPAAVDGTTGVATANAIGSPGVVVPEPTTAGLLLAGLLGLTLRRR